MTNYESSSIASTFGKILIAPPDAELPDTREIMQLFEEHCALLLRGFPFNSEAFVDFSDRCCGSFSAYVGGGIRFRSLNRDSLGAGGTLMSTTGGSQGFPIPLHGEMYYQARHPDMLWFYCKRAPAIKGYTTLADGRDLFVRLRPESQDFLRTNALRYVRELSREDWQMSFMTQDEAELRRLCDENEMQLEMKRDGSVHIEFLSSGLAGAPGSEVFINNAILLWHFEVAMRSGLAAQYVGGDVPLKPPLVVRTEDYAELPEWLMRDIDEVTEAIQYKIKWRDGDVALVDNRRILHGRTQAVGNDREILVRLGNLAQAAAA
jgi:alpha-ketoglutarate-dependent taurine dioxygenase